ncbi:hypothetical protein A7U60_g8414 [Sanghuangporus baumii]|uniref:Aminoacyl-transfer RNA synthetases class-II family profile domain-containing protein n=1 Tax=Sanghuangporus baumii TaxID=108892 RepID=A0A9Q5HR58_SANBA|nr:hypothetical protein A7U60_g8414 [Sanghuangporus baumii]
MTAALSALPMLRNVSFRTLFIHILFTNSILHLSCTRKISNSVSFFSIRDSCGTTQLVVNRDSPQTSRVLDELANVPVESIVLVHGSVRLRPQKAQRKSDRTGEIEVLVKDFTLLNPADHMSMPFLPSDSKNIANEELRARFRHLDLRRQHLTRNLRRRSRIAQEIRNFLHGEGFIEVETPMLLRSTPEGAREFLVPTRLSQHELRSHEDARREPQFYSLAQSPQQPKQLLICSGAIDRYFQIARCFRDEDGRKDRQPEFTQVDLEMAFVSWGSSTVVLDEAKDSGVSWRIGGQEVRDVIEGLMKRIWTAALSADQRADLPIHFPVMKYADAMARINDMTSLLSPAISDTISSAGEIVEFFIVRSTDASFSKAARSCQSEDLDGVVWLHLLTSILLDVEY